MTKLNNSILTHGVSFPYGNRRLGIARIRRLQFIASPTFGYSSQRVPDALSWLELSRRVERVVRAAPALLVVNSESARVEVSNEITSQAEQLNPLLQRSRNYKTDEEEAAAVQAATLVVNGGVKPGHVAEQKWATLVR